MMFRLLVFSLALLAAMVFILDREWWRFVYLVRNPFWLVGSNLLVSLGPGVEARGV